MKKDKEENSEGDEDSDNDNDDKPKQKRKQVECIMGDFTPEQLRNMHPQRTTHEFSMGKSKLTITSDFDAGNMARCEQMDSMNHFNIWMSSDSMPYYKYTGFRTWFFFGVKGVERGRTCHFHIKNLNFQRSLYAAGLKPFFRVGKEGRYKRIPGKLTWNNGQDGLQVNFDLQFSPKDPEVLTYFSFVEPWGYEDSENYFTSYHEKIKKSQRMSEEIYFHRELLGYSKELRFMELITITGNDGDLPTEQEDKIDGPGLFPAFGPGSKEEKIFSHERCLKFDKPVVFFSARVHPGEVQASHVLNGICDFLFSKSDSAAILLEKYVFKIIPLVNPDGVARGYYRLDTHNHNLNRFYLNPSQEEQPTVYQVKKAVVQQKTYGNLQIYIDLHGHASKKGCFIFGNNLKGEQQAQNMLFARLISLNSLNFDFQECSFSEKLMSVKDGGSGLSREGSGRVGIYKATGLINCYTLECHYQTGRRINALTPKLNLDSGDIESEEPVTDRNSKIYKDSRTPNYTTDIFEDVGNAVCIALLEWIEMNPISRMPTSHYKNLDSLRKELIVQNSLFPYEQMKEMRKEVAKEREQMKARQSKIQSQIASKQVAEAKKAAKLKEKEERAEAAEKAKEEKEVRIRNRKAAKVKTNSLQLPKQQANQVAIESETETEKKGPTIVAIGGAGSRSPSPRAKGADSPQLRKPKSKILSLVDKTNATPEQALSQPRPQGVGQGLDAMTISTIGGNAKPIRGLSKNRFEPNSSAQTNPQSEALVKEPTGQKSNTGEAKTRRLKKERHLAGSSNVEPAPSSDRIKEKLRQNESRKQKSRISQAKQAKSSTLTKPFVAANLDQDFNAEVQHTEQGGVFSKYDPQSIIENQFSDIYNNMGSTITKQNLLDQLEKKKAAMEASLMANRRPLAQTGKRKCDMKMVQIQFGENVEKDPLEEGLVGNEAPPKFLGNGKFGMIQGAYPPNQDHDIRALVREQAMNYGSGGKYYDQFLQFDEINNQKLERFPNSVVPQGPNTLQILPMIGSNTGGYIRQPSPRERAEPFANFQGNHQKDITHSTKSQNSQFVNLEYKVVSQNQKFQRGPMPQGFDGQYKKSKSHMQDTPEKSDVSFRSNGGLWNISGDQQSNFQAGSQDRNQKSYRVASQNPPVTISHQKKVQNPSPGGQMIPANRNLQRLLTHDAGTNDSQMDRNQKLLSKVLKAQMNLDQLQEQGINLQADEDAHIWEQQKPKSRQFKYQRSSKQIDSREQKRIDKLQHSILQRDITGGPRIAVGNKRNIPIPDSESPTLLNKAAPNQIHTQKQHKSSQQALSKIRQGANVTSLSQSKDSLHGPYKNSHNLKNNHSKKYLSKYQISALQAQSLGHASDAAE